MSEHHDEANSEVGREERELREGPTWSVPGDAQTAPTQRGPWMGVPQPFYGSGSTPPPPYGPPGSVPGPSTPPWGVPGQWSQGPGYPGEYRWGQTQGSVHATTASWRLLVASIAVSVLAVGALGVFIGHSIWKSPTAAPAASAAPSSPFGSGGFNGGSFPSGSPSSGSSAPPGAGGPADAAAIASKVDPGLVDINTTLSYQGEQAAGTGMVLSANGVVLTNNHVIEGATTISVTDVGNAKTYNAYVIGYDRSQDVAVIQLMNASGLQTVNLGSSSGLSVGEAIVGVGNAGGSGGTPSYAPGSITALNQSITASDSGNGTTEQLSGLVETNAGIEPGDSGGPLANSSGKVIGMDTAASAGFQFSSNAQAGTQAFAIPINEALAIAKEIRAHNASSTVHIGPTAFMGVEVASTSQGSTSVPGGSSGFGGFGGFGEGPAASAPTVPGAQIAGVVPGTPAASAGLVAGDTITAIDGVNITSPNSLTQVLFGYHPGQTITVDFVDPSGQSQSVTMKLASGPPQ